MLTLQIAKTIGRASDDAIRIPRSFLALFAGAVVLSTLIGGAQWWRNRLTPAQEFDCGDGRAITLLRSGDPICGLHLHYVVKDGESSPPAPLPDACACSGINYRGLRSADGNLVALVDHGMPARVLVMHDFATHLTWPAKAGSKDASDEGAQRMLERLRSSYPDEEFTLGPTR
jgi:hypothetical protein